jgi:hypothetical protein
VLEWYKTSQVKTVVIAKQKIVKIKVPDWLTLDSDDLRFKFSQVGKDESVYQGLKKSNMIFNVEAWLKMAS